MSSNGESPDKRGRGGTPHSGDGIASHHCFNCTQTGWKPGGHLGYKMRKLISWLGGDDNLIQRLSIEAIRLRDEIGVSEEVQLDENIEFEGHNLSRR